MNSAAILIENIIESEGFLGSKRAFICTIRYLNNSNNFTEGTYIFGSTSATTSFLQVLNGLVVVESLGDKFRVRYCFDSDVLEHPTFASLNISSGPFDEIEKASIKDLRQKVYNFIQITRRTSCSGLDVLFQTLVVQITKLNHFRNIEVLWFCYILSLFFLDDSRYSIEAKGFLEAVVDSHFQCIVKNLSKIEGHPWREVFFLISDSKDRQLSQSRNCLASSANRFRSLDELSKKVVKNSVVVIYGHGSFSSRRIEIQRRKDHNGTTPTQASFIVSKIGRKINTMILVACNSGDIKWLNGVKFLIKHNTALSSSSYYVITLLLKSGLSKGLTGKALHSYLFAYLFVCTAEYANFELKINDRE